jgi:hypothetical protein
MRNGIPLLLATSWSRSPFQAEFDTRVVLGALALTVLTGLLFSLAPAWQQRKAGVSTSLKESTRTTASLSKLVARKTLVVFQIALSLLLVVGAGLFVTTLTKLKATPLGFEPNQILLFRLDPPRTRYPVERMKNLFQMFEEKGRLVRILNECIASNPAAGVRIAIGSELGVPSMRDFTVITSSYPSRDNTVGFLGIIGPTRMEYERGISVVSYLGRLVGEKINA